MDSDIGRPLNSTSCNRERIYLSLQLVDIILFETHLLVFLLTDVRSHNSLPFRASILTNTRPFSNRCGTPNSLCSRPNVLADISSRVHPLQCLASLLEIDTPPHVHSLQGSTFLLIHCLVFDFNTICNRPSPPPADIVLFGLSFSSFLSRFLKYVY